MGLTKRRDSYYVEFRVIESEDGKSWSLASGIPGAKKKRWKVGGLNKTIAREMESAIKTRLLLGHEKTEQAKPILFRNWAKAYLDLESIKTLRSYQDRLEIVERQLVPFFGGKVLTEIRPHDVEVFRAQRKKKDGSKPSIQTVNNDHIVLKHCLNVAIRRGLLQVNPASRIPLPDLRNARDRVLTEEEWSKLYQAATPHLRPVLLTAYQLGQRLSEIVGLTWDRNRQPLRDFRTAFRTALTEAGLSDFRFHDLRHCAATNLRRAGIDTTTAMQIVGHASPQMWKRYNQIREEDLTQAANKLGKYLQENTPGTLDPKAESL
jgi:integrase